MKVFIDSNVLFSAALFPGSTPARALYKALKNPMMRLYARLILMN
ncbi:hypothetical protein ACTQZS_12795 [Bilifractor sp. LCP19S3_H10]